jgi:4-cresol dehydrogenase (hydroxylating) flavoprotein subunit
VESARSVIVLVGVFYDKNDAADADRALAWYRQAVDTYMRDGYPPYRATPMSMPGLLDQNPPARDFLATVKRALDPGNVIAPGRYGTPPR